jgi:hypothetical protein
MKLKLNIDVINIFTVVVFAHKVFKASTPGANVIKHFWSIYSQISLLSQSVC